jgi:hypothetical protein
MEGYVGIRVRDLNVVIPFDTCLDYDSLHFCNFHWPASCTKKKDYMQSHRFYTYAKVPCNFSDINAAPRS